MAILSCITIYITVLNIIGILAQDNMYFLPLDPDAITEGSMMDIRMILTGEMTKYQDFRANFSDKHVAIIKSKNYTVLESDECNNLVNFTTEIVNVVPLETKPTVDDLMYQSELSCGQLDIQIEGLQLGRSILQIYALNPSEALSTLSVLSSSYEVVVIRPDRVVDMIMQLSMTTLVIIITFGFGCEIDLKIIWDYLKKPIAPAIGFFSQFLCMPLIGLAVSQALRLNPVFGFGLVALACSPGGGASNSWTILLGGDVNLSLTMTFLSTTLALVMMPIWLFMVSRLFLDSSKVQIPFLNIISTLAMIVVPCFLGILLRRFFPKAGKFVTKLIKPLSLIFVVWVFTFGQYANFYMWRLMSQNPVLLPAGLLLPWVGFAIGFGVATACRQPRNRAITIAIETGIQNIGIPIIMLQGNFPQPDGDLAATMANSVGLFTPIPLFIALIAKTVYTKFFKKPDTDKDDNDAVVWSDDELQDDQDVVDPDKIQGTLDIDISDYHIIDGQNGDRRLSQRNSATLA